jgi:hypothetical protein
MSDGEKRLLKIRRLMCYQCKKIHHELPDIIVPYKRHCTETIENIVAGVNAVCEESTLHRIMAWWATIQLYIKCVLSSLSFKYGIVFSADKKLPEIVRSLANTNLWPGTRSASMPAET